MKPVCPTQFPACLLCDRLVSLVFTACLYVFPACPAEMLLTLRLKTGRLGTCPSQVGYVYDRPVCFQVWSVCVYGLYGGEVLVLNQNRTAIFSRQDGYSIGQDGTCNQQVIEICERLVSRWVGPLSGFGEISNMFDISWIHCNNLANYNQS